MNQRIRIRRSAAGWNVERPRLGFGQPERRTFPTWPAAVRWADRTIARQASAQLWTELPWQPNAAADTTSRRTAETPRPDMGDHQR